jgi:hypothetical protein
MGRNCADLSHQPLPATRNPPCPAISLSSLWPGPWIKGKIPLSPTSMPCSSNWPSAPIPNCAVPRTSGRVASGLPTPPHCRGRHLGARDAHFCDVADRFCAASLPSPADRCAAMPGPSSVPTSSIRAVTCRQPRKSNPFPLGFLCRQHLDRMSLGACPSHVVGAAEPHRHIAQNKRMKTTPLRVVPSVCTSCVAGTATVHHATHWHSCLAVLACTTPLYCAKRWPPPRRRRAVPSMAPRAPL